jgi:hypothetical protein
MRVAGASSIVAARRPLRKKTRATAPTATQAIANRPIAMTTHPAPCFFLPNAVDRRVVMEGCERQGPPG